MGVGNLPYVAPSFRKKVKLFAGGLVPDSSQTSEWLKPVAKCWTMNHAFGINGSILYDCLYTMARKLLRKAYRKKGYWTIGFDDLIDNAEQDNIAIVCGESH